MYYSTQQSFFAYESIDSATSCEINKCLNSSKSVMLKTYDVNMDAKAWNVWRVALRSNQLMKAGQTMIVCQMMLWWMA